jgi:SPP1 family predicted phage head-tail adaptor
MMSAKLRRVIRIQRASATVNDAGTPAFAWSDHMTLRAELVRQSTEEFLGDQGARDEAVAIFRTRYVRDVTTRDRVLFQGEAWNIRQISELGSQRGLELRCTRGAVD